MKQSNTKYQLTNKTEGNMKSFLKSSLLFLSPFVIITLGLIYIDAYNIIQQEKNPNWQALKYNISYKLNYPLYQLQQFDYEPSKVVILGDSRAKALNASEFEKVSKLSTKNVAYGGGTIIEAIETFWYLTDNYNLESVYIGLSFNLSNKLNNKNRVEEVIEIRQSKITYLTSKYCLKASAKIFQSVITGNTVQIGKPKGDKAKFWKYQLENTAPHYLKNYTFGVTYFEELKAIVNHCKDRNIELTFFIPPNHIDLQNRVKDYQLEKEYDFFVESIKGLNTKFYDFNFPNRMTENKDNYGDPFHYTPSISIILSRILAGDEVIAKKHQDIFRLKETTVTNQ